MIKVGDFYIDPIDGEVVRVEAYRGHTDRVYVRSLEDKESAWFFGTYFVKIYNRLPWYKQLWYNLLEG